MLDSLSIEEFTEEEREILKKLGEILNSSTPGELPEVRLGDFTLPSTLANFLSKTVFILNHSGRVHFYSLPRE